MSAASRPGPRRSAARCRARDRDDQHHRARGQSSALRRAAAAIAAIRRSSSTSARAGDEHQDVRVAHRLVQFDCAPRSSAKNDRAPSTLRARDRQACAGPAATSHAHGSTVTWIASDPPSPARRRIARSTLVQAERVGAHRVERQLPRRDQRERVLDRRVTVAAHADDAAARATRSRPRRTPQSAGASRR